MIYTITDVFLYNCDKINFRGRVKENIQISYDLFCRMSQVSLISPTNSKFLLFLAQHLRIFIDRIFFKCFRIILEGRQSKLKTAKMFYKKFKDIYHCSIGLSRAKGIQLIFKKFDRKKTPDGQEKNSRHSTVSTKTKRKYQMSLNVS